MASSSREVSMPSILDDFGECKTFLFVQVIKYDNTRAMHSSYICICKYKIEIVVEYIMPYLYTV